MKCIVTGDTGFIGGALYHELINRGDTVLGISRSSRGDNLPHEILNLASDPIDKIRSIVHGFKPDIIFHFAADPLVKNYTFEISQTNILSTHKLLDCCPDTCMFALASSATVYGRHSTARPVWKEARPISVYGMTKLYCENIVRAYSVTYGKVPDYRIFRFCAHVGKGNTHGLAKDIVRKLRSDNPNLELFGKSPGPRKPYIHIDKSIEAILGAVAQIPSIYTSYTSWSYQNKYNISPNDNMSVLEVANVIMNTLNIYKPIKWLGKQASWPGDDNFVRLQSGFTITSADAIRQYAESEL